MSSAFLHQSRRTPVHVRAHRPNERGLTLLELLISMSLGLVVVLAATALLLSTKSGYVMQDEHAQIQDAGRYALESIARSVRQAAFENWDTVEAPVLADAVSGASIAGLDAKSLSSKTNGISSPTTRSVNGSDVLAVRFFGAGGGTNGDGSMRNCAGFGVAGPTSLANADESRGWSIFYVANDASGEPELYCKFRGDNGWAAHAIARGVESFQVLYGLDTDVDNMPNQFLNASAINALDESLVLEGTTTKEQAADRNRKTLWKKVVVVKVAMLVRGTQKARADELVVEHSLFGSDYADANGSDTGVRMREEDFPTSVRNRVRKVFASTIQLRNQSSGGA